MVKQNQKNITKITKEIGKTKREIVTQIFLKKKNTKIGNMDEKKYKKKNCLKKIKKTKRI